MNARIGISRVRHGERPGAAVGFDEVVDRRGETAGAVLEARILPFDVEGVGAPRCRGETSRTAQSQHEAKMFHWRSPEQSLDLAVRIARFERGRYRDRMSRPPGRMGLVAV